jgi:hypothetical protein
MLISVEGIFNKLLEPGQESTGDASALSHCFCKEILTDTDRCAGALS